HGLKDGFLWRHPTFSRLSETFCRSHPNTGEERAILCRPVPFSAGTGASIFWLKNGRFSYRH
ncbi:hypothetical protein SL908_28825, partial [Klebsiella pneumoniae]